MLMAMSNEEKWLNHTKSGHFFVVVKWSSCAGSAFLNNGRRVRALDIFKKSQAVRLKHYGRLAEVAIYFGVNMKTYFLDNCLSLHQPPPPTHIVHI